MTEQQQWEDRWDQAWPLLTSYLPVRDLVACCLSSNSINSAVTATPGVWSHVAAASLGWPPTPAAGAAPQACSSAPPSSSTAAAASADEQARRVLFAVAALAHHVKHSRSPPPQTVSIPPWLPAQPGIARGFVQVDASTLDPPLLLTATQLSLLAHGSLAGHTAGVFISGCSSSPRSHQACSYLAAVVINKTLVAELYIPRNTTPADPWAGILNSYGSTDSDSGSSRRDGARASSSRGSSNNTDSTSGGSAASCCPVELWLSSSVQLQQPKTPAGGGRAARRRRARNTAADGGACCWSDVCRLITQCIVDNASRCRAVRGTSVIPPGTATAAAVERQLMQLAAAGGPLLDLRRLQFEAAAAEGSSQAPEQFRQQQWEEDMQRQMREWGLSAPPPIHASNETGTQQQQQNKELGQVDKPTTTPAAARQAPPSASGWCWQAAAMAALQSALVALHTAAAVEELEQQQEGAASAHGAAGAAAAAGVEGDERSELLAALVEQLADVAPDVQLLVLPVLLPGGRAAQRVPSIGGSRLSAPRLLCLNVPFLMALRKHAWERLPHLRHVLLMAGPPLPLPQQPSTKMQQQHSCRTQYACGSASSSTQPPPPHHDQQRQPESGNSARSVVPGTFTLQELEQQWQTQLQLGERGQPGQQQPQQQQSGNELWDVQQQDQWFAAQQAAAAGRQQLLNPGQGRGSTTTGSDHAAFGGGGAVRNGDIVEQQQHGPSLSRAAVDALHDMLHSCMDRLC